MRFDPRVLRLTASTIALATCVGLASCKARRVAPAPLGSATVAEQIASNALGTNGDASAPAPSPPPPAQTSEDLVVEGFTPAVVSVPTDRTRARPLVVAAHGWDDSPEGQCGVWRAIVEDRAFVLCPRGFRMSNAPDKGFSWQGAGALAKEVDAAIDAVRARHGAEIADGPILYAGFSFGATLGVEVVQRDPARFAYVVLAEGGEDAWTLDTARRFRALGGKRVLLMCALKVRMPTAVVMAARLERGGVGARAVLAKLPGKDEYIHWYDGPVADETRAQLDWLVEGDARWAR